MADNAKTKFNALKVIKLKELCRERELSATGTKAEIVQRLTESYGADEVEVEEESDIYKQINELRDMLKHVMATLSQRTNENAHDESIQNGNVRSENEHRSASMQTITEPQNVQIITTRSYSVREIAETIPEFDPRNDESLTATQFIDRVNNLKRAYMFDEKCLLLAIYSRMKGVAKMWLDATSNPFLSWNEFAESLKQEFDKSLNEAEIHFLMANAKRKVGERLIDFSFRISALGRKYNLSEQAIIRYMREGVEHRDFQIATAAMSFVSVRDLRETISQYEKNLPCRIPHKNKETKSTPSFDSGTQNNSNEYEKTDVKNRTKNRKCFNCNEIGHFAANCTKVQRKQRCNICNRTTHSTSECTERHRQPNVQRIKTERIDDDIKKYITVNDKNTLSIVDPGSKCTLIRESFAKSVGNLESCNVQLQGFAGGKYSCKNKINANVKIDKVVVKMDLLLVNDNLLSENVLLGKNAFCQTGKRFVIEGNDCWLEQMNVMFAGNNLESGENKELFELLNASRECFANKTNELGKCSITKMRINLMSDNPVKVKPYRLPFAKRPIVAEIINDLLSSKIIRPSNSPYASPVVLVEKNNGEHRLCVDYRLLNKITVKTPYPMKNLEEQFAQLSGNRYFTCLDLRMGYHQIEVEETSKQYTAFVTTEGHYEYNRMPFGLVNAPAVFQRVMDEIVCQMGHGEILVYLDDVIIPSRTAKEGHIVSENGITPGTGKVNAIRNFKVPANVTEIRRFLGLTGFFRKPFKLVTDCSAIAKVKEKKELIPKIARWWIKILEKRLQANENIKKERDKWKQRFDQKHTTPKIYKEGDLVVLENDVSATGESRKLESKYRGPYVVSKVLGRDRYLVEDIPGMQVTTRKYSSVYTTDKMKPWCRISPELDADDDVDPDEDEDVSSSGLAELS